MSRNPTFAMRALVGLFAALVACGAPTAGAPHTVTSFGPERTIDPEAPLQITFDHPMVDEDRVGKALDRPPAALSPSVPLKAHWLDRQTLVLVPTKPLTPGTRYQVLLSGELAGSHVAGDRALAFVHQPFEWNGFVGGDADWLSPTDAFVLAFTLPVSQRAAAKACAFTGPERVGVVPDPTPTANALFTALRPARALRRDTTYAFRCEGLVAEGGNEPLDAKRTFDVHVRPTFDVAGFEPSTTDPISPDEGMLRVTLTTPMSYDALRDLVEFTPKVDTSTLWWSRRGETSFEAHPSLRAKTKYRVRFKAGIKNSFGEALAADREFTFETGSALPRVSMEPGAFAVERAGEGYQIWTRNVRTVDVACAAVPAGAATRVLTNGVNFWPWHEKDAAVETLDWKALGLTARHVSVDVTSANEDWHEHRLNLAKLCGTKRADDMVLAELRAPDMEAKLRPYDRYPLRVLANVTSLGVVMKAGSTGGVVWVTDLASGEPVPGAHVRVFDGQGKPFFTGDTDASGLVRLPSTRTLLKAEERRIARNNEGDEYEYEDYYGYEGREQRLVAVVERGDDTAVVDSAWRDGLYAWNFGHERQLGASTRDVRGFIQSDRGIYRPKDTVHFQGWVREISPNGPPALLGAKSVEVELEDARGTKIKTAHPKLTAFGGFTFDHTLDEGAPLGDYVVRAKVAGKVFRERFSVEEYRPIAFDLKVTSKGTTPGDAKDGKLEVPFQVDADYLFGAPVADAEATWNVSRHSSYVSFPAFGRYSFYDWYAERSDDDYWASRYASTNERGQDYVGDGAGKTDAAGRFTFSVSDDAAKLKRPANYRASVSVRDATGQTVTRQYAETVHPTDRYLGVDIASWVARAKTPFDVNAVAVTTDGKPVAGKATLVIAEQRWQCGVSGVGGSWRCKSETKEVLRRAVKLAAGKPTPTRVSLDKGGEYVVRIEGKDTRGRDVAAATSVWVIGAGRSYWGDREEERMDLVASEDEYRPGDTATLVPRADIAGTYALVTTERLGVMEARVERVAAGEGIDVPVSGADAPNVYVSVVSVRGRTGKGDGKRPRLRMGVQRLVVATEANRLQIEVKTEREAYEPGERVRGEVRVTQNGAPVSAEVALSVADEGVLRLIDYHAPDPHATFYAPWPLGVDTSANWIRVARDHLPRGMVEEGSDGAGREERMRSRFVASAYWAPALVTGADGRATFEFDAPDNLTAFRVMANAADKGQRFGVTEGSFRVKKDFMAEPVLPRFFREDDRVQIGAVARNFTDKAVDARVTLEATGLKLAATERTVRIAPNGTEKVLFEASVPRGGDEARIQMRAKTASRFDGFEVKLPIHAPLVDDARALLSAAGTGALGTATVEMPEGTLVDQSDVELMVDRTGLAELAPSLRYLIAYPYGCLEQTLSRTVPLLKVKELAEAMDLKELKRTKLDAFVDAGVKKIVRFQHDDGHFSLWVGGEARPELTAYALWGLAEAKASGTDVPNETLDRGYAALSAWLNARDRKITPGGEAATMALGAYVLAEAGRGDASLNSRLFESRGAMPVYGAAFLLRALVAERGVKAPEVAVLVRELESRVRDLGGSAYVEDSNDRILVDFMSSNARSSAILASALLRADPSHPLIPKLLRGLREHRSAAGHWYNTQEDAYALIAFTDVARSQAKDGAVSVTVRAGDKDLATLRADGLKVVAKRWPAKSLVGKKLEVRSDAQATVMLRLRAVRRATEVEASGFSLSRSYLDPKTGKPVAAIKVGQIVHVVLKGRTERPEVYVALADPIPAGFEALNSRIHTDQGSDDSASASGSDYAYDDWYDGWYGEWPWVHREVRDDVALAFADTLTGEFTVEYDVRATKPGVFTAPGASVEAMYEPTRHARTALTKVEVLP